MSKIVGVGCAVPKYRLTQAEIKDMAERHFVSTGAINKRYLSIFDRSGVTQRFFCVPPEWFGSDAKLGRANRRYKKEAADLSCDAIRICLDRSDFKIKEIDSIVLVTSSGICTPSLDTEIANRLGLACDIKRYPMFGLGCAGGAAGIALAGRLASSDPDARILVVAVELNSLTFQRTDYSLQNLVSTALFGDGAAAVLVVGDAVTDEAPLIIKRSVTRRSPDTAHSMGWDFQDTGFRVVISDAVPELAAELVNVVLTELRSFERIDHINSFVFHPGSTKILDVFERETGMGAKYFACSRRVLSKYGNLSGPTVMFCLADKIMARSDEDTGPCLLGAFGPGFTAEASLLYWT